MMGTVGEGHGRARAWLRRCIGVASGGVLLLASAGWLTGAPGHATGAERPPELVASTPRAADSRAVAPGAPAPGVQAGAAAADTLPRILDPASRRWVDSTLASLSLPEALGQLIFQWIPGGYASTSSAEFLELERWVTESRIGGVAISIGTPLAYALKLNALQARARIPLLVTSDFENGGPGMRINHSYALPTLLPQGGGTSFPPTMALAAIRDSAAEYVSEMARVTALEARAVGVHLNFAPVLDVNSNPANPIINTRSFGEEPERVAELGAAYLRGARTGGILTTAKHFPGHGDTETDSHLNLPAVTATRDRLDSVELVPFRRALAEGVDAVMTAHVAVPAILGEGGPPATFAPEFLTGLLREEMGFDGLLFTDALRMGAITERYGGGEAAVLAFEAGADVILIPDVVEDALEHLVAAVEEGRISRERIDASVRRILEAKARVGVHRERRVDLEAVGDVVGAQRHLDLADRAASRSIVLVHDAGGRVPIGPDGPSRIVSVTFARSDDLTAGRTFDTRAATWVPALERIRLDDRSSPQTWADAEARAREADLVLVNVYLPPRAGAGSVAVSGELARFVEGVAAARPVVVTSFGSPYVLSAFPSAAAALVAWGDREVSQMAGARALFGEERIDGVLPTSVPPLYALGAGLIRVAVRSSVRTVTDQLDEAGIVVPARPRREEAQEAGEGASGPAEPSLVEADPAEVGMSAEGLAAVDRILEEGIRGGATPGAVLAVGRGDRLVRLRGYGRLGSDPSEGTPDPRGTLYDIASLTKVVGTTSAIMLLVDRGAVELDAPVTRYLPGWDRGDSRKGSVTVRDLLLHRGGLPAFRTWFREGRGRDFYERAIEEVALEGAPRVRTVYSDIGFMTLGLVVEAVDGRQLDRFLEDELFRPLGMSATRFTPDPALRPRVAPTENDGTRGGMMRGEVHDENAWSMGGVAGHAGLFSTAEDLARFTRALAAAARGGAAAAPRDGGPARVRPGAPDPFPTALAAAWTRRADAGSTRALGWDTPSDQGSSAGDLFSRRSFGHTGFTGTSIWVDPDRDLWIVLLTNRVHPTRENNRHVPLRRAVHDAVVRSVQGASGSE